MSERAALERYQWRRNKEAGQEFGSQLEVRPLDEASFRQLVQPLLVYGSEFTLAQYQRMFPRVTHYAMVRHAGADWRLFGVGDRERLRPAGAAKQWALAVPAFDVPEAVAWGQVADSEVPEQTRSEKAVLVPLDPAAAAAALKRHFTQSEIAEIVRLLRL